MFPLKSEGSQAGRILPYSGEGQIPPKSSVGSLVEDISFKAKI